MLATAVRPLREIIESGETWWGFTFGQAYDLKSNFVLIQADDPDTARAMFVAARRRSSTHGGLVDDDGRRWSMQYPVDDKFEVMVLRWSMSEVAADAPIHWFDRNNPVE